MFDRDALGDHPTHRDSDNVGGIDVQGIQQTDSILRHVGEVVVSTQTFWSDHRDHKFARERQVGVLGLGKLGGAAARALRSLNFQVLGWSRTPRQVEGVECFHGADGLAAMLRRAEILVCLLPLTPATERILNAKLFAQLPHGAYVINVGRGKQCAIDDLVAALDSGQLGGALLDVFPQEPLPVDSALWDHPKLRITPHIAAMVMPRSATKYVVDQIRAFESGKALVNLVDRGVGY